MKLRSLCIVLGLAFFVATGALAFQATEEGEEGAADSQAAAQESLGEDGQAEESANATTEEATPPGADEYPEALVITRNGQWVRGGLKFQSDEEVILVVAGIDLKLSQREVRRLELLPSLEERYRARRARISDNDHARLLSLAEWLRDNDALEWALDEIGTVLDADPDNAEARRLFYTIGAQITMQRESRRSERVEDDRLSRAELYRLLPDNRITEREVNLLRVYEIDLEDPPRMVIPRGVRERLIEEYTGDPLIPNTRSARALFMQQSDATVLGVIFRLGAREFYDEVRVLEQPKSLRRFRDEVHRKWLLSTCGTTNCHGGLQAGRFFLHSRDRGSDRTVYSNFLTLERFRTAEGEPLLDFDHPEDSVLLQLGLPHDLSAYDHPGVEGWRPIFRDQEDGKFRAAVAWLRSHYRPRPNHAIEYEPPTVLPPETFEAPVEEGEVER
ncbi:MAG: hypothetical protein ACF8NJ_07120 [Phycisphaerales bacterium JB038]